MPERIDIDVFWAFHKDQNNTSAALLQLELLLELGQQRLVSLPPGYTADKVLKTQGEKVQRNGQPETRPPIPVKLNGKDYEVTLSHSIVFDKDGMAIHGSTPTPGGPGAGKKDLGGGAGGKVEVRGMRVSVDWKNLQPLLKVKIKSFASKSVRATANKPIGYAQALSERNAAADRLGEDVVGPLTVERSRYGEIVFRFTTP